MDIEKYWEKAIKHTEVERARISYLNINTSTILPYIILSESMVDNSDTVIRKGKIEVTKPVIYLPDHTPILEGFEFEDNPLSDTVKKYKEELIKAEDVYTGLIIGPDDCWQFSLLIYVAGLVMKSAPQDIKKFLEELRKKFRQE
ncbi:MAG: hypothetical protein B6D53_04835 [Candidatus Omnitrophica bacterium 4484_49]|nr:MAG: hypothetical protein B6D53_04835 [Candidatus Omnitrophica bacterium 4484_49]